MISSGFEIEARSFPGLPAEDQRWERAVEMGGGLVAPKIQKKKLRQGMRAKGAGPSRVRSMFPTLLGRGDRRLAPSRPQVEDRLDDQDDVGAMER